MLSDVGSGLTAWLEANDPRCTGAECSAIRMAFRSGPFLTPKLFEMIHRIIIILVFLGLGFSSCDEDDVAAVLPDFDAEVSTTENIPISVDKTDGEWVEYSSTTNVSIINDDTEKYLNKIRNVNIKRLRYRVLAFNGDPAGEVQGSFSADNGKAFENRFTVRNAFEQKTVFEVDDVAELNRIANALKTKHTIQVRYSGMALCDQENMDFTIQVEMLAVVTINP